MTHAYATAGVDYRKIDPFKQAMQDVGRQTLSFPNARGVYVEAGQHGALFQYRGSEPHLWCQTQEGLGNKNWIAEWMYRFAATGVSYYRGIAQDTVLMAVNDLIAQGAMPCVFTDEVAAGDSEWFDDKHRTKELAEGFLEICREIGCALPAGESPSLRYLVRAEAPVLSAPVLSGCVTGIIAPAKRRIQGHVQAGDCILAVASSGIHANGISLVIKQALELPDAFLTKLPNGRSLGEEALIPTMSYVRLVESLLSEEVVIHSITPGTGGGVAKIAKHPFTHRIHSWVDEVPSLMRYMHEVLGVDQTTCLLTFNWGVGYYIFTTEHEAARAIEVGRRCGYDIRPVGRVEEGEPRVIFEPYNITLTPLGE
jgi:phosphoribosylformylglycinamidine cyclo-ligase